MTTVFQVPAEDSNAERSEVKGGRCHEVEEGIHVT